MTGPAGQYDRRKTDGNTERETALANLRP